MAPRTPEQYEEIRFSKHKLILETAMKLFASSGYHNTSISKIAKEAAISKGLIYNYFDSKEDLLKELISQVTDEIMDMLNPDHDDEITTQELNDFFDLLFNSLHEKPDYWKLYFQLTIQAGVLETLIETDYSEKMIHNQKLIYKHFYERYEKPDEVILMISSMLKGFTMQFVYYPKIFSIDLIERFKIRLKDLFIKPKIYDYDESKIDTNDILGFSIL
jgi:AcrR family transcriptional regulator